MEAVLHEYEQLRKRYDCFPAEVHRKIQALDESHRRLALLSTEQHSLSSSTDALELNSLLQLANETSDRLVSAHDNVELCSLLETSLSTQIDELGQVLTSFRDELGLNDPLVSQLDVTSEVTVCTCKNVEIVSGPIISCSNCGEYFHNKCVSLPPDFNDHFFCHRCHNDHKTNRLTEYPSF
ncbi:hypothetical protein P9112_002537 [Eukaryota sp. TZLM1-RC]